MNTMDTTKISTLAMELIEQIERDYSDWEGVEFGTVALVLEISGTPPVDERPDPDPTLGETEPVATTIVYRCSDPRRWIQNAFMKMAYRSTKRSD